MITQTALDGESTASALSISVIYSTSVAVLYVSYQVDAKNAKNPLCVPYGRNYSEINDLGPPLRKTGLYICIYGTSILNVLISCTFLATSC